MRQELNRLIGGRDEAQAKLAEWELAPESAGRLLAEAGASPWMERFLPLHPEESAVARIARAEYGDGEYRVWTEL